MTTRGSTIRFESRLSPEGWHKARPPGKKGISPPRQRTGTGIWIRTRGLRIRHMSGWCSNLPCHDRKKRQPKIPSPGALDAESNVSLHRSRRSLASPSLQTMRCINRQNERAGKKELPRHTKKKKKKEIIQPRPIKYTSTNKRNPI